MNAAALSLLIYAGGLGVALICVVALIRSAHRSQTDKYRKVYQVHFPRDVSHDQVLNFIRALSGLPTPKPFAPAHTVVFDTFGDENGIRHYLSIPGHVTADVSALFRTHIKGGSLVQCKSDSGQGNANVNDPVANTRWDEVTELATTSSHIPLRIGSPEAVTATMLSGFSGLGKDQKVLMQWVVLPARFHPAPDGADAAKVKEKLAEPNFLAVGRLASAGPQSNTNIRRLYTGLSSIHTYGMRFRRVRTPASRVRAGIYRRSGKLVFNATLNAKELSVLIGYPFGSPNVSGINTGQHLKAHITIPTTGALVLGNSTFPGDERPVAIPMSGLTMHKLVLGPTGSGKSVSMVNDAVALMKAGHGLVVLDPKTDLASDILMRIPENRIDDVVYFDPTDTDKPIGLNVLEGPDPELTAPVVAVLEPPSVPEVAAIEATPADTSPADPPRQVATRAEQQARAAKARKLYRDSVARGKELSGKELAAKFEGMSERWARLRIQEAKAETV